MREIPILVPAQALPLRKPTLQNGQLVRLDARESDAHPRPGNDRHDTTQRSEGSVSLRDSDLKLFACWRRVPGVNEAPADAKFAGLAGTLRIRGHIGHFGIRNEQIAWPTTPFTVHLYHFASRHDFSTQSQKSEL